MKIYIVLLLLVMHISYGIEVTDGARFENIDPSIPQITGSAVPSFKFNEDTSIYCQQEDGELYYVQDPEQWNRFNNMVETNWRKVRESGYVKGDNRWYIECPDDLTYVDWWEAPKADPFYVADDTIFLPDGYIHKNSDVKYTVATDTQIIVFTGVSNSVSDLDVLETLISLTEGDLTGFTAQNIADEYFDNDYSNSDLPFYAEYDDKTTYSYLSTYSFKSLDSYANIHSTIEHLKDILVVAEFFTFGLYDSPDLSTFMYSTQGNSYYLYQAQEGDYRIIDNKENIVDGGSCDDNTDNDGDGLIDCADPDCYNERNADGYMCQEFETYCADGYDNDLNGLLDCLDPHCDLRLRDEVAAAGGATNWLTTATFHEPSEEVINTDLFNICEYDKELTCSDGEDNDADGLIDCNDNDCELINCDSDGGYVCQSGQCVEYIPEDVRFGSMKTYEDYYTGNYYADVLNWIHDMAYHANDCGDDYEIYGDLYENGITAHRVCVPALE